MALAMTERLLMLDTNDGFVRASGTLDWSIAIKPQSEANTMGSRTLTTQCTRNGPKTGME